MSHTATDVLRVVSILAVLVIHATGKFEAMFSDDPTLFSSGFLAVVLNQLTRFAVPVFVFLSGFGLASRYKPDSDFSNREFLQKRMSRIGLPFLFWTIVFLFGHKIYWSPGLLNSAPGIWEIITGIALQLPGYLFLRGADYHLYFFIIILQCYLVFPLIRSRRSYFLLLGFLCLHLIFTFPGDALLSGIGLAPPRFSSSFLIYWIFYFYAGVFFSAARVDLAPRLISVAIAIGFGFSFVLMLLEFLTRGSPSVSPGDYDHFNRWTVCLYACVGLALFARLFGSTEKSPWITYLSGVSFSVFILHTTVLRFLESTFLQKHVLLLILFLWTISFLIAILLEKFVPWRWPRIILGLPESASVKSVPQAPSGRS